jgi:hypothetical protein
MKIFCVSLIVAGIFIGCATPPAPDAATHYHSVTGARIDLIPDNLLEGPEPARELVWLNASRVFETPTSFEYYLELHYEALEQTGLIEIEPGQSLTVIADDEELVFTGNGSENLRKTKKGLVSEDALYIVQPRDLRTIARAQKVRVRVMGRNGSVQRDFGPANSQRFRTFVRRYVDGESS